jgi:hypothetical protein
MKAHFGTLAMIVVTGSLALGGCATTGSVKRAQARADQAFVEGQKGQADGAAARAQGGADALAASGTGAGRGGAARHRGAGRGQDRPTRPKLAAAAAADARAARAQAANRRSPSTSWRSRARRATTPFHFGQAIDQSNGEGEPHPAQRRGVQFDWPSRAEGPRPLPTRSRAARSASISASHIAALRLHLQRLSARRWR